MKHKNSKKFVQKSVTVMLASLMLSSVLTGCSKEGDADNSNAGTSQSSSNSGDKSGNKSGKTTALDISFDHSYSSEEIKIDGMKGYNNFYAIGENFLINGYDEDYESKIVLYHPADGSVEEVKFAYPETLDEKTECYPMMNFVNTDGNLTFIFNAYSWDEENEENPYQELGYTMEVYDADMNVLETKDVSDMFGDDVYFQTMLCTPDGGYYAVINDNMGNMTLATYDKDFKKTGEISGEFQYINTMFLTKDNTLCVNYQDNEWNSCFGKISTESQTIEAIEIADMPSWFNGAFAGNGNYDFYFYDSTAVYGANLADGRCEEVVNFLNSDFMGESVNQITMLPDGQFMISTYDYDGTGDAGIYVLTERDPKEFENVQMITLATFGLPSELSRSVRNFNRQNSGYRIGIVDYNKYSTEEDWEAGMTKFENDMTSGIVADIICTSGISYEKFANKGIFLDLSDYFSTLNPDEYFMNTFDTLRYGDTLNRIGFSFNVQTLQAKTEFVGDKSGIAVSEFIELIKNLPDGTEAFREMTQSSALYQLCMGNLNAFIDVEHAACTFNTPEFVQLLELCKSYPAENDSMNDKSDEEWEAYWEEYEYQYINNKTLFRQVYLSDIKQEFREKCQYFDGADLTYIGYPTVKENSNGGRIQFNYTLAISANSELKDQVWGFFTDMLSEESQEKLSWQIPVRKEAFDKKAEEAMQPETYEDQNGETQLITWYRGNEEIEQVVPTQEDIDVIKNYIMNVTETTYYDNQIYTIIQEETEKFFSGDQTAQAAADMIQSRASLYLSEQS
ncbi:MAG: extracellular solute-binding protein [Oscillospiraceae bacterium]|nr:extracellular solute-binding protein [Oscillospiraceae bacterium]